jgi:hypothetical protein
MDQKCNRSDMAIDARFCGLEFHEPLDRSVSMLTMEEPVMKGETRSANLKASVHILRHAFCRIRWLNRNRRSLANGPAREAPAQYDGA